MVICTKFREFGGFTMFEINATNVIFCNTPHTPQTHTPSHIHATPTSQPQLLKSSHILLTISQPHVHTPKHSSLNPQAHTPITTLLISLHSIHPHSHPALTPPPHAPNLKPYSDNRNYALTSLFKPSSPYTHHTIHPQHPRPKHPNFYTKKNCLAYIFGNFFIHREFVIYSKVQIINLCNNCIFKKFLH